MSAQLDNFSFNISVHIPTQYIVLLVHKCISMVHIILLCFYIDLLLHSFSNTNLAFTQSKVTNVLKFCLCSNSSQRRG